VLFCLLLLFLVRLFLFGNNSSSSGGWSLAATSASSNLNHESTIRGKRKGKRRADVQHALHERVPPSRGESSGGEKREKVARTQRPARSPVKGLEEVFLLYFIIYYYYYYSNYSNYSLTFLYFFIVFIFFTFSTPQEELERQAMQERLTQPAEENSGYSVQCTVYSVYCIVYSV